MLPTFENGWCLMKTNKVKPTGYKGYIFALYDKDDITVIKEIRAKTARTISNKIKKLLTTDKGGK